MDAGATLTAQAFVAKWQRGAAAHALNERAGATCQYALDAAVAAAYGWADWTPAIPDDEILRRLLALNLARATGQR